MELKHIDTAKLFVSAANMRAKGKADLSHILPTIRARGVIVPLIVRPAVDEDRFEIVAGKRRYYAALEVAAESGENEPLPCAIMAAGDDAAALEASLIENVARLDPDEVTLWEGFTRLVREGRSPEDIALTFGLTELQVKRTLALGNLLPSIRTLYRKGEIEAATVRHLTLASKARQREWLALRDDPDAYCPTGYSLKAWLFGGSSIPVSAALFEVADYQGEIVSDLFGDERYFADSATFWTAQTAAVEAKAESYREAGWEVIVLPTGEAFQCWQHERCAKRKGGKVFIAVGSRGDVAIHEGYVSCREARKREKGEAVEKPIRPEISALLQNYIDLHRHAAVRADLASQPSLALRLMVAHAIAGSPLWNVRIDARRAQNDAISESVEACASEAAFDEKRRAVLALLGFDPETPTVTGGYEGEHGVAGLFARLIELPDPAVLDVLAIVMGETLEAGSALIELLGPMFGTDMAKVWTADDVLLDLIRDREVMQHVLTDVAGERVASENDSATGKVKRGIVRDCLSGENGRAKVEGWVPGWMAFPPSSYTERGGVGTVSRAAAIGDLAASQSQPEPLRRAA
ncbi:chromosome partitioning protein ParB [Sphingomonas koreensis]|uniref:ParB/RepB/Spo0J family partition protein n=1 Tax=Sphingomonas koreensis TaxID=93064 RepID=UPI00082FE97B|nr:ParB N-terminal domain-containing protein [Sphingomonas koreensis]PJI88468.1 ParB family chromosome partitioning protein [Sphingomonas koreensis]RSU55434.1 chromosome partitioning protein ParB [Sphingomonas koreensis]RSU64047.1 chromosome partitioning protein ParB [Sphingomonas koreensis]